MYLYSQELNDPDALNLEKCMIRKTTYVICKQKDRRTELYSIVKISIQKKKNEKKYV